jgi:hypothetical protein
MNISSRRRSRNDLKQTALWPVFDGRAAVGHVLSRGVLGFESFSADDESLGTFISLGEAANAVLARLSRSSSTST